MNFDNLIPPVIKLDVERPNAVSFDSVTVPDKLMYDNLPNSTLVASTEQVVIDAVATIPKPLQKEILKNPKTFFTISPRLIKVCAVILRNPELRDIEMTAHEQVGGDSHLFAEWASAVLSVCLNDTEKRLIELRDRGLMYSTIGEQLKKEFPDFAAKHKNLAANQVNNWLNTKMPRKIARYLMIEEMRHQAKRA